MVLFQHAFHKGYGYHAGCFNKYAIKANPPRYDIRIRHSYVITTDIVVIYKYFLMLMMLIETH